MALRGLTSNVDDLSDRVELRELQSQACRIIGGGSSVFSKVLMRAVARANACTLKYTYTLYQWHMRIRSVTSLTYVIDHSIEPRSYPLKYLIDTIYYVSFVIPPMLSTKWQPWWRQRGEPPANSFSGPSVDPARGISQCNFFFCLFVNLIFNAPQTWIHSDQHEPRLWIMEQFTQPSIMFYLLHVTILSQTGWIASVACMQFARSLPS